MDFRIISLKSLIVVMDVIFTWRLKVTTPTLPRSPGMENLDKIPIQPESPRRIREIQESEKKFYIELNDKLKQIEHISSDILNRRFTI
jgi:hypothetical protein